MWYFGMFFFFKQKTAYEMLRSLVGSEMCIRDSHQSSSPSAASHDVYSNSRQPSLPHQEPFETPQSTCLLYTSDAADEEDSVDLGGCRIIKKKKTYESKIRYYLLKNKHKQV
eukprot:TRINITY_DN25572_c0_g1_i2.p1 TRINITY_DN25572_c0_g1~~TRINITY_DN25572_c0_g1_i2.p1  ORF type:complete len:112 (-),score=34.46 TRINITY_DN25572_c0_g1_i2:11-346(-)